MKQKYCISVLLSIFLSFMLLNTPSYAKTTPNSKELVIVQPYSYVEEVIAAANHTCWVEDSRATPLIDSAPYNISWKTITFVSSYSLKNRVIIAYKEIISDNTEGGYYQVCRFRYDYTII